MYGGLKEKEKWPSVSGHKKLVGLDNEFTRLPSFWLIGGRIPF